MRNKSINLKHYIRPNQLPFPVGKRWFKIYKDGNHYVGTSCLPVKKKKYPTFTGLSDEQIYFDKLYKYAVAENLSKEKRCSFLKSEMQREYPELENLSEFIEKNTNRNWHNAHSRLKRFKRKAQLNLWNYFVTFTYDSKKMCESDFRLKLRKCLSNLHSRRKWRYMGVFERGEENDRLHFHAILYVPEGQMIGELSQRKDYSAKEHNIQITHSNTFFVDKFGRNDFDNINPQEIANGKAINYITKYINKTGEKIVYSRGIPSEIYKEIEDDDVATELVDYCVKYVLFDDSIDVELDVMNFNWKQASFFDSYYLTG